MARRCGAVLRLLALWAAAAAVVGVAEAQPPVDEWVSVEIAAFSDPIKPLQKPEITRFAVDASCLLGDPVAGVPVQYTIVDKPEWLTAVISPASDARAIESCESGRVTFEGQIIATANDRAPAFTPAPITIEARVGVDQRAQVGSGMVNATAAYFPILDLQLAESIAVLPPGGSTEFRVTAMNAGNGPVRIEATLIDVAEGLTVALPPPLRIGSRQQGATDATGELVFGVATAPAEGIVNRVGHVNVRILSAYAEDPTFGLEENTVSFLVTTRTGAADDGSGGGRLLPLAWLLAPAALAAASALRGRRQG